MSAARRQGQGQLGVVCGPALVGAGPVEVARPEAATDLAQDDGQTRYARQAEQAAALLPRGPAGLVPVPVAGGDLATDGDDGPAVALGVVVGVSEQVVVGPHRLLFISELYTSCTHAEHKLYSG